MTAFAHRRQTTTQEQMSNQQRGLDLAKCLDRVVGGGPGGRLYLSALWDHVVGGVQAEGCHGDVSRLDQDGEAGAPGAGEGEGR